MPEAAFVLSPSRPVNERTMRLKDQDMIFARRELLCCDLPDGSVILDPSSGVYYGLDAVGTYIWTLIQQPIRFEEIVGAVLNEYAVEPDRCFQDLQALFSEMVELHLVEIRDSEAN